jgi:DNA-binding transcriptional regulator GbsR (MarR family)
MGTTPEQARQRAIDLAAETMGELVSFWGFKTSMGRIWTLLYLSPEALPADVIAERTQLSAGAVSMALAELAQWGIIRRELAPGDRKRHYAAETDVWGIVRRIFRERELRLVDRAVERFGAAIDALEEARREHPDDEQLLFMLRRLRGLHDLARIGYRMLERFAEVGKLSLLPIRGRLVGDANHP